MVDNETQESAGWMLFCAIESEKDGSGNVTHIDFCVAGEYVIYHQVQAGAKTAKWRVLKKEKPTNHLRNGVTTRLRTQYSFVVPPMFCEVSAKEAEELAQPNATLPPTLHGRMKRTITAWKKSQEKAAKTAAASMAGAL